MPELIRREFLKVAAAVGTAAIGTTAGCLSQQTECSGEDMLEYEGELHGPDDMDRDLRLVLRQIENLQGVSAELANEHLGPMYGGEVFDAESVGSRLYEGSLDPEGNSSSAADTYDILCRVRTHSDTEYGDIGSFLDENRDEAELGLSPGFTGSIAAVIETPIIAREKLEEGEDISEEDVASYDRFRDSISGIRAQIADPAGSYVDVYVPEEVVDDYTEKLELVNDPRGIYMEMRNYVQDNMTLHTCEGSILDGITGSDSATGLQKEDTYETLLADVYRNERI